MEYLFSISLILIFGLSIFITYKLNNQLAIKIILNVLSLCLLIWKIIEFSYYAINKTGVYPIEFSHIAYFVVTILVLTQYKKLYFTAGIFAFIAGIGYLIPAVVLPHNMIYAHDISIVIMGVVSHMTLLFMSLLLLFKTVRFEYKNLYIPTIFFILTIIYVVLIDKGILYKGLINPDAFVIIKIINGRVLELININSTNQILNYSLTILIYIFVAFIIWFMNFLNHKFGPQIKEVKVKFLK